ncbi:MAG: glycerol kinase GlpK [Gemmataceae bacterium]
MPSPYILAIDQGTTSTRALVFDDTGQCLGSFQKEFSQYYPRPGWVEHDLEEIWQSVVAVVPAALQAAGVDGRQLAAIGLTNQRETVALWERGTSKPLARAIVWQDRRTSDYCRQRLADEPWLFERTGLVLDPYFSAPKMRWLLDQDPAWETAAHAGQLAFGTIDAFLIHRLSGGQVHRTDTTNASRTLLMDLHRLSWDEELCRYFGVPRAVLPDITPSSGDFGVTAGLDFLPDGVPITGVLGDQQAALAGQGGFTVGAAKCTYGTGAFLLRHIGAEVKSSRHRLVTTVAPMLDAQPQYALEGSVFVAGAAVQWLRDGLRLLANAADSETLAARSDPDQPLVFVPGFVGLGAPHWLPEARGVLFGLTRGTTAAELARAALEGVAHQVADLVVAADADAPVPLHELRVDGGMTANAWFLQRQADLLGLPVVPSANPEATALGAALMAGWRVGLWTSTEQLHRLTPSGQTYVPKFSDETRRRQRHQWHNAVHAVKVFYGQQE